VTPWVCPKCGKVWGPFVMQCAPCNARSGPATTTGQYPPPRKPGIYCSMLGA